MADPRRCRLYDHFMRSRGTDIDLFNGQWFMYGAKDSGLHGSISLTKYLVARTTRRKFVSRLFHRITCTNNSFPRAKLVRYVRCAALALTRQQRWLKCRQVRQGGRETCHSLGLITYGAIAHARIKVR